MRTHPRPASTRRVLLVLAAGVGGALVLAACSSAAPGPGPSPAAAATTSSAAAGRPGFRGPAADGRIAAITGTTMQVQNQQTGQVAVRWTGTTTFTAQVPLAASRITVGACVTAAAGPATANGTASAFTAASLLVEPTCSTSRLGGPRPAGARPSGFPSGARPSGFPTGARRSGFPGGHGRAFAVGKVTAVSGATVTIAARGFGPAGATRTVTVTLASATRIVTTARATARSLAVGKCITAQGSADPTGTVTATRVQISEPSAGVCATGFGRGGFGG